MPAAWNERASPPPGFKEGEKKKRYKKISRRINWENSTELSVSLNTNFSG